MPPHLSKPTVTRGRLVALVATLLVAAVAVSTYVVTADEEEPPPLKLTFLHIADLHAHYHARQYRLFGAISPLALIKRYFDEAKKADPSTLIIDSGDAFEKGSLADQVSQGQSTVDVYRDLSIDLMVPGNHDFAYGAQQTLELCAAIQGKCVVSNQIYKGRTTGAPVPYFEFTHQGLRIGVLGLVIKPYNELDRPVSAPYSADFDGRYDYVEVAREIVNAKRKQVDLMILISHLNPGEERAVADEVAGIDLVFGGHTHVAFEQPVLSKRGALVMNAGCCGMYVGRLVVDFDARSKRPIGHEFELVKVRPLTMSRDPAYAYRIERLISTHAPDAEDLACVVERDLERDELAKTLADAVLAGLKADAVLVSSKILRRGLAAGRLSRQRLNERFPIERQPPGADGFSNFTTLSLSGEALLKVRQSLPEDLGYFGTDAVDRQATYRVALHRMHALNLSTFFPDAAIDPQPAQASQEIWRVLADHCQRNEGRRLVGG